MKTINGYRILFHLLLALLLPLAAWGSVSPDEALRVQTEKVLAELRNDNVRNDMGKLDEMVERLIAPVIDFDAISMLVLGKHWKRATPEQRRAFKDAFKKLLKNTYIRSLQEYANESIIYFPEKTRVKGDFATVYSEFVPGNGQPNLPIVYKLRRKNGEWKVYNLVVDGLSYVKNYRSDFSREIEATSLDALIARLERAQQ